mmetsp:Transcript_45225/g.117062  ORF Transcript_45225/g.117062 Transcript_45225/m.117062 type:complete len:229 (-) Transcript_45225:1317-2003(-)
MVLTLLTSDCCGVLRPLSLFSPSCTPLGLSPSSLLSPLTECNSPAPSLLPAATCISQKHTSPVAWPVITTASFVHSVGGGTATDVMRDPNLSVPTTNLPPNDMMEASHSSCPLTENPLSRDGDATHTSPVISLMLSATTLICSHGRIRAGKYVCKSHNATKPSLAAVAMRLKLSHTATTVMGVLWIARLLILLKCLSFTCFASHTLHTPSSPPVNTLSPLLVEVAQVI